MAVLVASWLCLTLYGYAALSALFEVSAALAAARLTGGITGAELPTPLKLVLSFDMLFGRVEIVALLLVLLPRTWLGRRRAIV